MSEAKRRNPIDWIGDAIEAIIDGFFNGIDAIIDRLSRGL